MATFNGKDRNDLSKTGHVLSGHLAAPVTVPETMLFSHAISLQFRARTASGQQSAEEALDQTASRTGSTTGKPANSPPSSADQPRITLGDAANPLIANITEAEPCNGIAHARPQTDVRNTSEIAAQILSAYSVDGGHIRLAGCQLEEVPIIRMTWLHHGGESTKLVHQIVDEYGQPVSETSVELLRQPVVPMAPPSVNRFEKQQLASSKPLPLAQIRTLIGDARSCRALSFPTDEFLFATVVWCKQAVGKVRVSMGTAEVDIPFSGLAKGFANGRIKPPAYACPHSGLHSYELALTDRGQIAAADAVAMCEVTGSLVLRDELRVCGVTGVQALADNFHSCSVSGEAVLRSQTKVCADCQQRVSPKVLHKDRCTACLSATAVRKDDPAMARILDEYPELDHWKYWRLSETRESYILTAIGLLQSLRLVIDRQTLDILQIGGRTLPFSRWQPLAGSDVTRITSRR